LLPLFQFYLELNYLNLIGPLGNDPFLNDIGSTVVTKTECVGQEITTASDIYALYQFQREIFAQCISQCSLWDWTCNDHCKSNWKEDYATICNLHSTVLPRLHSGPECKIIQFCK
jgi:hypothetical protein